jgi:hypothetical protein
LGNIRDLEYTMWFPNVRTTCKSGGKTIGALANALSTGMNGLFRFSQELKLKKKLDEMYPQIFDAMQDHTGVLVIVIYQQWKSADPAYNPPEILSIRRKSIGSRLLESKPFSTKLNFRVFSAPDDQLPC